MAARASFSEEDLLCPVCCEVFVLPVDLKCGHNSCKACLQKHWERKGCRECPVCRTMSVSERPPINLALKIAVDTFKEQKIYENTEERCILHNDKLRLFCQNDEKPICLVCQASKQHKVHDCYPVEEAAKERKVRQRSIIHHTFNGNITLIFCTYISFSKSIFISHTYHFLNQREYSKIYHFGKPPRRISF